RLSGRSASWSGHRLGRVTGGRRGAGGDRAVGRTEEGAGGRGERERVAAGEDRGRAAGAAAEQVVVWAAEGAVVVEDVRGVLRHEGAGAARSGLARCGGRREDAQTDGCHTEVMGIRVV